MQYKLNKSSAFLEQVLSKSFELNQTTDVIFFFFSVPLAIKIDFSTVNGVFFIAKIPNISKVEVQHFIPGMDLRLPK